jgi:DNA replication protein DnaC
MLNQKHVTSPLYLRAKSLRLWGVLSNWTEHQGEPWVEKLIETEEKERLHRSHLQRSRVANIGRFKEMVHFDWLRCSEDIRGVFEDLYTLEFIARAMNVIIVGPSGVGKTMIAKNLASHAVNRGYTTRFITASDLLSDLAVADGIREHKRKLLKYEKPDLLVIDELGYLSASNKHADLFFEVVSRRHEKKPIIITSNKSCHEWNEVFKNTGSIVPMIDRILQNAEQIVIKAESFRLKEALENVASRKKERSKTGVNE